AAVTKRKLMLIGVSEGWGENSNVRCSRRAIRGHALSVIWIGVGQQVERRCTGRRNLIGQRNGASDEVQLFRFAELSFDEVVVHAVTATKHILLLLERIPGETKTRAKVIFVTALVRISLERNGLVRVRGKRIEEGRTILPVIPKPGAKGQV